MVYVVHCCVLVCVSVNAMSTSCEHILYVPLYCLSTGVVVSVYLSTVRGALERLVGVAESVSVR